MGWRRLSAHTLLPANTTSLMAGAEEKDREKARIDITALLRARSWGTLRLLWRAPFPGKEDRARTRPHAHTHIHTLTHLPALALGSGQNNLLSKDCARKLPSLSQSSLTLAQGHFWPPLAGVTT